jgi:peptidase C39-like protein/glycosyl hydrolase family 25
MTLFLVDIASYQHSPSPINVAAAKNAGVNLVNIKTSQGTGYVFREGRIYADAARANNVGICTFHWLTNSASGSAQADFAYKQMVALGGPDGMAHECDTEDNASEQVFRDYVSAMQDKLGRHIMVYSGDWWWQNSSRNWRGSDLTPYYTAAPNDGYLGSYPGDDSRHWHAGYGGWDSLSMMQYAVSPMDGVGGGKLSKSAIRDHSVWTALTGGTPMGKVLSYSFQKQENGYFCGPAATRIAMTVWGKYPSQDELAGSLGTTTNGTNSSANVVNTLNAYLGAGTYEVTFIPGNDATAAERDEFRRDMKASIDAGYPIVANVVSTVRANNGNSYAYPGGHYVAIVGYDDSDNVKVADVNVGEYWVTVARMATWIAARGYASKAAVIPAPAPVPAPTPEVPMEPEPAQEVTNYDFAWLIWRAAALYGNLEKTPHGPGKGEVNQIAASLKRIEEYLKRIDTKLNG